MITKILAVKYPTSTDRARQTTDHLRQVFAVEVNAVREMIGKLLFDDSEFFRYNYLLVRYDDKIYAIEPSDINKRTYSRKQLSYHPLSHMV